MPKILLIEDNELISDMLKRRLQRQGFEVVVAEDGGKGIELARSEGPDLILMDLNLLVIDGWEATQKLKSESETSSIPVIALTAHAIAGDREKALKAGCDEYETKPIEFARLLGKIHLLLGGDGETPFAE